MELNLKDLKFSFDMSKTNYQVDVLQNRLIEFYLRADKKFRRAFYTNYTNEFLQFIKDKAMLREPYHLSVMGNTRSGKSYVSISLAVLSMTLQNKLFNKNYICGNAYEFIEKLKVMPEKDLIDSTFLIDEEKGAVFGIGSVAKKMKIKDVQNIIAINNINTIMLTPMGWQNSDANYGLRTFGRCFDTKTVRLMLYNLQEKGSNSQVPMGNIYLPIFTAFLPKVYADKLEKDYLELKNKWVKGEMRGENDALGIIKRSTAKTFLRDKVYKNILHKKEKIVYISQKLGSEFTKSEVEEIETLIRLFEEGNLDIIEEQ